LILNKFSKKSGQGWTYMAYSKEKDYVEIFPTKREELLWSESQKKKKGVRGLNVLISDTKWTEWMNVVPIRWHGRWQIPY